MKNDETVLFFIPSLVATLLRAEQEKGTPLSEAEVLQIRDQSPCVAISPEAVPAMIEERGYEDIDPDYCWEQWQDARTTLGDEN